MGVIIPMERQHVAQVGTLHHLYIRSILRDLGRRVCIKFYETALNTDENFGFVYVENTRVSGFILGTLDNSKLFRSPKLFFEIGLALLRKPWLIKTILAHLRNELTPGPEGVYSATDLHIRGKGIGKKLHLRRDEEFKRRGVKSYVVRIDADNVVNLNLTKKTYSARVISEFVDNGIRRFVLQRDIS